MQAVFFFNGVRLYHNIHNFIGDHNYFFGLLPVEIAVGLLILHHNLLYLLLGKIQWQFNGKPCFAVE